MVIGVRRSVRQHKDWPSPLSTKDPVVAVELANADVPPAATAKDLSGAPQHLVSERAALTWMSRGFTPLSLHAATTHSWSRPVPR